METTEEIAFQIISNVGAARSCFIKAIQTARQKTLMERKSSLKKEKPIF